MTTPRPTDDELRYWIARNFNDPQAAYTSEFIRWLKKHAAWLNSKEASEPLERIRKELFNGDRQDPA